MCLESYSEVITLTGLSETRSFTFYTGRSLCLMQTGFEHTRRIRFFFELFQFVGLFVVDELNAAVEWLPHPSRICSNCVHSDYTHPYHNLSSFHNRTSSVSGFTRYVLPSVAVHVDLLAVVRFRKALRCTMIHGGYYHPSDLRRDSNAGVSKQNSAARYLRMTGTEESDDH